MDYGHGENDTNVTMCLKKWWISILPIYDHVRIYDHVSGE